MTDSENCKGRNVLHEDCSKLNYVVLKPSLSVLLFIYAPWYVITFIYTGGVSSPHADPGPPAPEGPADPHARCEHTAAQRGRQGGRSARQGND
jgi:hypothetical protein